MIVVEDRRYDSYDKVVELRRQAADSTRSLVERARAINEAMRLVSDELLQAWSEEAEKTAYLREPD